MAFEEFFMPFQFIFMQKAFLIAIILSFPTAILSCFLVIAMVVTPGATAYLICDRFPKLIFLSVLIGSITCFTGAYLSFFIDGATGGVIVVLQTIVFLVVFLTAPKYGFISARLKIRQANKRIENGF